MPASPDAPHTHTVTVTEHLWIPMRDGTRLAARLWLPDTAHQTPVPALFEYIPYRKADMVRARDARNHPYFATHGYACLRVDMRGSGDSEGVMDDMYSADELSDARSVISWIAAQAWCSGAVGMFGTSWGGTAALQANVDAPDALKAVIAVCATHDRYEDDIHHKGGCLLTDTLEWGATLPAILAAPPTPNVGEDWMAVWRARLDALTYPVETWLQEEARGAYWRRGSVIHDTARLSRPTLAIGGWSDRYSNSVMSLVAARPDLVWGVVGPWGHHYPDRGHPGPAIGFQDLALEWWDTWLRPSGRSADWPKLRTWVRHNEPPLDALDTRDGGWIETGPPDACTTSVTWSLGSNGLVQTAVQDQEWSVPADPTVGRAAGDTGYFGRYGGLPLDQSEDDTRSLTFDTPPLPEDQCLYGAATLELTLAPGFDRGHIIARLNDVAPDGAVSMVARAVRNLGLDETLDRLDQRPADQSRQVKLIFPTAAYRFGRNHRIRVSLSASYWPMIWPSRVASEPRIMRGHLSIPSLSVADVRPAASLPPARDLPASKSFSVTSAGRLQRWSTVEDGGVRKDGWHQPYSEVLHHDIDVTCGYETQADFSVALDDPQTTSAVFTHRAVYRRADGTATLLSHLQMSSTPNTYVIEGHLSVEWDDEPLFDKTWAKTVPRHVD